MAQASMLPAVQRLLNDEALRSHLQSSKPDAEAYLNLAIEVLHSLRHQHSWADLKIHINSPLSPYGVLSRPLLSGLPPRRLYVHPDEQIEHLKLDGNQSEGNEISARVASTVGSEQDFQPVREWVLPTQIRETWTLSRLANIFDAICHVPPDVEDDTALIVPNPPHEGSISQPDKWRTTKRLLLATVDDDSTVVYYIVHDGIVKPRQN